jgi:hypothetical protein
MAVDMGAATWLTRTVIDLKVCGSTTGEMARVFLCLGMDIDMRGNGETTIVKVGAQLHGPMETDIPESFGTVDRMARARCFLPAGIDGIAARGQMGAIVDRTAGRRQVVH